MLRSSWASNVRLTLSFHFLLSEIYGPTSDSVAFSVSSYYERLSNGDLSKGYWIAADEAYMYTETVITPFSSNFASSGTAKDGFKFYQSSHRMRIEQAFGTMIARWGILWRPLRFSLSHNIRAVQLAMCLHNFCIDQADHSVRDMHSEHDYNTIQAYATQLLASSNSAGQSTTLPGRRSSSNNSNMHRALLQIVEDNDIRRPTYNWLLASNLSNLCLHIVQLFLQ